MTEPTSPPAPTIPADSSRTSLDVLAELRADHDAGRLSTADLLSRIAVMQAAAIGLLG